MKISVITFSFFFFFVTSVHPRTRRVRSIGEGSRRGLCTSSNSLSHLKATDCNHCYFRIIPISPCLIWEVSLESVTKLLGVHQVKWFMRPIAQLKMSCGNYSSYFL